MSRLIRVAEAVALTGLSERLLRQAIAEGRLAVVRPAGVRAVLIPEHELATFTGAAAAAERARGIAAPTGGR
jgi:excisionase family DNA binding protein